MGPDGRSGAAPCCPEQPCRAMCRAMVLPFARPCPRPACLARPAAATVYWPHPSRAVPRQPLSLSSTSARDLPDVATTSPTEQPQRPPPNENYLLINAFATHPESPLLAVSRRIADAGCNLADARLATVGRDVSVLALAMGSWDAVAKLESSLGRLEREDGMKLVWYRTGPKPLQSNLLPYIVEVVAADKPGILFQLADFFDRQGITIENLHCSRYRAMQTGADMFSAQITVGIPSTMHIAAL